ncbi:unnamed protein product [Strongylus vulgaris]|uniref:Phosphotransferase n=1 Tax=Strongylus vulgaris TaxID=40348 RepID=A0A3P7IAS1_STRVU|nr:unnamed protein product [Strongylus vulgaris]
MNKYRICCQGIYGDCSERTYCFRSKYREMQFQTRKSLVADFLGELDSILTQFDKEIDAASVHQGKQIIDKLTGALYLGELVRRILSQLVLDRVLFDGQPCEKLDEPDAFPTKYISEILAEEEDSYKSCRRICDELDVPMHGSGDYHIIRDVCYAVSDRSAAIVAAAISALLRHLDVSRVKIGVGGALIQFHPIYHKLLHDKLVDLAPLGTERRAITVWVEHASAAGTAMARRSYGFLNNRPPLVR